MENKFRLHMLKIFKGVPEEDYRDLRRELTTLAQESVKREVKLAKLEAEVIGLKEGLKNG